MSAKPFDKRMGEIPASFFSCDMNGSPVDAYIARYRAVQVASEADALVADLLEALILMVRILDEPAETLLQEAKEQQWLRKARDAIAKAIGGAS